mmetsp:Transcript_46773/g.120554  ORF Transcript_46773/g.120554 Transcript_46773/m.120554 type:complete len:83 (-) Transcript_46773:151-399(-)
MLLNVHRLRRLVASQGAVCSVQARSCQKPLQQYSSTVLTARANSPSPPSHPPSPSTQVLVSSVATWVRLPTSSGMASSSPSS